MRNEIAIMINQENIFGNKLTETEIINCIVYFKPKIQHHLFDIYNISSSFFIYYNYIVNFYSFP